MDDNNGQFDIKRPGISTHTLRAAEVRRVDYPEPGSIEIPYWSAEGDLTQFKRWRLPFTRANGQKYHQEAGSGVYAYYPPGFFRPTTAYGLSHDSRFWVEGEMKALSLLELGVYAIGLPSFTVYTKDEEGRRQLLGDLQRIIAKQGVKTIYYLGDADTATNFEFSRNAAFLASWASNCKVFLPRIPMDRPKGIDDCKEALNGEFHQFFTGLIRDAVPIDKRLDACSIALLLLEREQEVLKGLTGVERERQFARIIKLCASAQSGSDSQATTRLHRRFARDGREFPSAKKNRVA
jgi:hypothetical protein